MKVKYERFGGRMTREDIRAKAAEFATGIGRENVISISESFQNNAVCVTVWYWD